MVEARSPTPARTDSSWRELSAVALAETRKRLPREAAGDIAQDVLAALVPRFEGLRSHVRDLRAYVRVMASNGSRRWHLRRHDRREPLSLERLRERGVELAAEASATGPGLPRAVPRELLVRLLLNLPSRERRVLVRHVLHHQSVAATARALGLRRLQVRRSMNHVLAAARRLSR